MFCYKCGKEISDKAQFCNFCGAQMSGAQTRPAPAAQPVQRPVQQPVRQAAEQPAQQAEQPKENKAGKRIVSILVAVVVFFVVRYATENMLTGKKTTPTSSNKIEIFNSSSTNTSTSSSGEIEIFKPSPVSTCYLGGLYQNDELIYGSAKVRVPGYSLLPGEDGGMDFLMSPDGTVLVSVNKTIEVNASYDASTEEGMLRSFQADGYMDVRMIDFRKYMVDGYPVIRYIVNYEDSDLEQYVGELIILPSREASEALRIDMYALAETGYTPINTVFDTLSISPSYALDAGDTTEFGLQQITAK